VPLQHDLESWTDYRAVDGTVGIVQPLVRPFYAVRSAHELLDQWQGTASSDHGAVQATWRRAWSGEFDSRWQDALVRGFVRDSAPPVLRPRIADRGLALTLGEPSQGLMVSVRPDPSIWDGRFANNAWLQETPKPMTKLTWGNAILVAPALARQRHLKSGDRVRLQVADRTLAGPVWILPGQDAHTVTITLGYGRRQGAVLVLNEGYDANALCGRDDPWLIGDVILTPTGESEVLACTQPQQAMDGYDFVRTVADPVQPVARRAEAESFYPPRRWDSPSWGMAIDLDLCIGCNACVVACTAENNVPVVGKDLVAQGREMHWLRVDRYHTGNVDAPQSWFQPVPCMHCEQAPCEMGCPVNATVHSGDGLNLQVYNRCIGTRTCSAYCPYKVRRFNWFDFTGGDPQQLQAMRNPDVTVRTRGVMEKCTYCVQRISVARIAAKLEGRAQHEGDVVTACQQACPTQAITFGDVTDPQSAVSRSKSGPRNYSLLEEANTRPRTTYLARIGKPL
jgi:molybdopterin-containing oxidoreductase family iron-sulfur binding subunit